MRDTIEERKASDMVMKFLLIPYCKDAQGKMFIKLFL